MKIRFFEKLIPFLTANIGDLMICHSIKFALLILTRSEVQKENIVVCVIRMNLIPMYQFYYYSSTMPVIALAVLILFLLSNYNIYSRYFFAYDVYATNIKEATARSTGPTFNDPNLRAELVVQGLSYPTSMAFINNNNNNIKDILVLQKNNGEVRLVSNCVLKDQPVLKVDIDNSTRICCRGLLGIATKVNNSNDNNSTEVFLYLSEAAKGDQPIRNRVYKYQWNGQTLINPKLILDLPAEGLNHPGGKLAIGPDQYLYAVIGDLNRQGKLQNFVDGPEPDDTSVILRVNPDNGFPAKNNPFLSEKNGNSSTMSRYFAYGIRNSFGLAFDPVSGTLWDAENGDKDYDEINVVNPGFNSGWKKVMGPISKNSSINESQLLNFPGSKYADPVFSWFESIGVTDIAFLNSSKLGDKYKNNIFVGDITKGNLYFFEVNENRTGLKFDNNNDGNNNSQQSSSSSSGLLDKVADNKNEVAAVTLATGFRGITDIKSGPDGLLYILTFDEKSHGEGKIYKISAASTNDS